MGDKYQLALMGDFTDRQGVSLTNDYLTYGIVSSSQPNVLSVDRGRAYTTLEGASQIAAIDLLTMRQIDISHEPGSSLPDNNPTIDLPPGSRPFAIVIDAQDKYAYISDRNSYNGKGKIYVLDIDPTSHIPHFNFYDRYWDLFVTRPANKYASKRWR